MAYLTKPDDVPPMMKAVVTLNLVQWYDEPLTVHELIDHFKVDAADPEADWVYVITDDSTGKRYIVDSAELDLPDLKD